MNRRAHSFTVAVVFFLTSGFCAATSTVYLGPHDGKSVEFFGPDDLHLDPATNMIAVDVFGDQDREVKGVTFLTDGRGLGVATARNGGTGVEVTTTAVEGLDNYAAAPAFTGVDQVSADNLAEVMRDVRFEDTPAPVTVDIQGLTPGARYEVQILFNEGADRNRHFDIAVEDQLVVDNFTSEGEAPDGNGNGGQVWTPRNSFAYVGNFDAPPDGTLNFEIQRQIGGQPAMGSDLELGLQAIIVHLLAPKRLEGFQVSRSGGDLVFAWRSQGGKLYNLRSETDPATADPADWPVYQGHAEVAATPPGNTLTVPLPQDPFRLFVVEEINAPPVAVFSDDFESGQGAWVSSSDGSAGTDWELGPPGNVGPSAAHSGTSCFGTNIEAAYAADAIVSLRSAAIDLTSAGGATLKWAQVRDIEAMFDSGAVNILDAADNSVLAVIEAGIDGTSSSWEDVSRSIPAPAVGKMIKIEFLFTSDNFNGVPQAGWYIDDVAVTVP